MYWLVWNCWGSDLEESDHWSGLLFVRLRTEHWFCNLVSFWNVNQFVLCLSGGATWPKLLSPLLMPCLPLFKTIKASMVGQISLSVHPSSKYSGLQFWFHHPTYNTIHTIYYLHFHFRRILFPGGFEFQFDEFNFLADLHFNLTNLISWRICISIFVNFDQSSLMTMVGAKMDPALHDDDGSQDEPRPPWRRRWQSRWCQQRQYGSQPSLTVAANRMEPALLYGGSKQDGASPPWWRQQTGWSQPSSTDRMEPALLDGGSRQDGASPPWWRWQHGPTHLGAIDYPFYLNPPCCVLMLILFFHVTC